MHITVNPCGCIVTLTDAVADTINVQSRIKDVRVVEVKKCPACREYEERRNRHIYAAVAYADKVVPNRSPEDWNASYFAYIDSMYLLEESFNNKSV